MAETAAHLSDDVFPDVPLRQWVISFPFPLRYLFAAHPQAMGKVLGIVYRAISTHLIRKAGLQLKDGATGAVTLIQRFGWYGIPAALNLNIHFHILLLDSVYVYRDNRPPRFQRIKTPDKDEFEGLAHLISQRVGRCLERQGLLEQDSESAWLDLDPAEDTDAMPQILGSSVSYRVAVGPKQGRKAFMIRTIRPLDRPDPGLERVAINSSAHKRCLRNSLCSWHTIIGITTVSNRRLPLPALLNGNFAPNLDTVVPVITISPRFLAEVVFIQILIKLIEHNIG